MLLNLIDHLPSYTATGEAMSKDEEALRAAVEANGGKMPEGNNAPSLAHWSTEAGILALMVNEIRALKSITIQVNSKPGAAAPKIEPVPQPETAWPRIAHEVRLARHRELVGRLIPKRAEDLPPQE